MPGAKTILLVAAARPNFMKIAPIWHELQGHLDSCTPLLLHTGQHYDANMSDVFFADLGLPRPRIHLGIGGGSHAENTGGVMIAFEKVCLEHRPDMVVVVGDVNSTMACSITARKLQIPVAHVEAGLRSRDWTMPEEINRIVTDAISDLLLTPSRDANANLLREGVAPERIRLVGNIMIDSLVRAIARVKGRAVFERFGLGEREYGLVTLHRPANVDAPDSLRRILAALERMPAPVLFPVHPRTRNVMEAHGITVAGEGENPVLLTEPLPYDDFVNLMMHSRFVLTDSGGIQEETTWLGIPCLTLRPNTERPITITEGTNELTTVTTLPDQLRRIAEGQWKQGRIPELWDGHTAERIVAELLAF